MIRSVYLKLLKYKMLKPILLTARNFAAWHSARKLMKAWKTKQLNENIILSQTYGNLYALSKVDVNAFGNIADFIFRSNIKRLKSQAKIDVAFVLYSSAMWSCDDLYQLLERDEIFNPYIIVSPAAGENLKISREEIQRCTMEFFEAKGYKVKGAYSSGGRDAFEIPQIAIYLTPYPLLDQKINLLALPLSVLSMYIPYGFMLVERDDALKFPVALMSWIYFSSTKVYRSILQEKMLLNGRNVVFSGYSKMDAFEDSISNELPACVWKGTEPMNRAVKIIYAPHHSISESSCAFSTFAENYEFIFEYAKHHPDTTSWILKPHPNLKDSAVKTGVFPSEEAFDAYIRAWNALPNARVVLEGSYIDVFKTSDGMILDSVSFLAEYQYTGKPLLFLTRPTQKFNAFGVLLREILYTAPGSDFDRIAEFIQKVLIEKNDPMKSKRKAFFDRHLNYRVANHGKTASETIYRYLKDAFC